MTLDWLLEDGQAMAEGESVTLAQDTRLHIEREEVELSAIARTCQETISPREVKDRILDLMRKRGIQIVSGMSLDKLIKQYRELRAKSAKH